MAAKEKRKSARINPQLVFIQKLSAGVSLLAFLAILVVGLKEQIGVTALIYRAGLVLVLIGFATRFVMQILSTFEEINSGET